jgi:hypothetical protein
MFSIAKTSGWLALGAAVITAGCATGPTQYEKRALSADQQQVVADKPAALQPLYKELFQEGRRNEVLNLMEIGAEAFHQGHYDLAKTVLDRAILNIESVYADNEAARRARSLWYEEGEKEFKGEPYERSMVYYYRGLLFLRDADYGNARASFISGLLQDAFAEEEQHTTDFASLIFLAGWAAKLDGNDSLASDHFQEYQQFRPDGPVPDADDNVLVIAETGTSPRKLADGVGHYQLVYRRGKGFTEQRAHVQGGGVDQSLYPVEDVFFQASTRGGRTVDRIIEGQVKFKQTSENVGSALTSVSQSSTLSGIAAASGGAVSAGFNTITAIGVAAQGLSARSKTRADTRYWTRLPDALHVMPLSLNQGDGPLKVSYRTAEGQTVPGLTDQAKIHFDKNGNGLVFASARH